MPDDEQIDDKPLSVVPISKGRYPLPRKPPPRNGGRPRVPVIEGKRNHDPAIHLDILEAMTRADCTQAQIAAEFNITVKTLQNAAKRDKRVRDCLERGKLRGDATLLRKQMAVAMDGSVAMLIHLGRLRLGQKYPDDNDLRTIDTVQYQWVAPQPAESEQSTSNTDHSQAKSDSTTLEADSNSFPGRLEAAKVLQ